MDLCKNLCLNHSTQSCSLITYYPTARGYSNNCMLHCQSGSIGVYQEANTYELLVSEVTYEILEMRRLQTQAGHRSLGKRWEAVLQPLRDLSKQIHRFRPAAQHLAEAVEVVQRAMTDLSVVGQAGINTTVFEFRMKEVWESFQALEKEMDAVRRK